MINDNLCVVFDLDDTLYSEMDFVRSAYRYISKTLASIIAGTGKKVGDDEIYNLMWSEYKSGGLSFETANNVYGLNIPVNRYLEWYRTHSADIKLREDAEYFIKKLYKEGIPMCIISDGRSLTQRNKIKALGLDKYIKAEDIVISEEIGSEKPSVRNYEYVMTRYPGRKYMYIGDNPRKDFITPNSLGWITIGIVGNEENIHPVNEDYPEEYQPARLVESFLQI